MNAKLGLTAAIALTLASTLSLAQQPIERLPGMPTPVPMGPIAPNTGASPNANPLLGSPTVAPASPLVYPAGDMLPPGSVSYPGLAMPGDGPIMEEFFLRTGPSLPVAGGVVADRANTGWLVEIGGRTSYLNQAADAAWVIEASLRYQYNRALANQTPTILRDQLVIDDPGFGNVRTFLNDLPVTLRQYHRWYVGIGGGRDWYLAGGPTSHHETLVRVGADLGGRWGTSHVNLLLANAIPTQDYIRKHDVIGAFYMGGHINLEIPFGAWTWFVGFRAEWSYTWSDIIRGQSSDIKDVNLLINSGFRF
jgi:hypothetical protein